MIIIGVTCAVILEIFTLKITSMIEDFTMAEIVIELAKKNYKFSKDVVTFKVKTGYRIIPILNFVLAKRFSKKLKSRVVDELVYKDHLVEMTKDEIEKSKKMDAFELIMFTTMNLLKDTTCIACDRLTPLAYTEDEVKELNEVTTNSYKFGKLDGINVAFIGIPNDTEFSSNIRLVNESYIIPHTYLEYSEEDAKDKTFIVYPYTDNNLEKVHNKVTEIIDERNKIKEENIFKEYSVEPKENYEDKKYQKVMKKTLFK